MIAIEESNLPLAWEKSVIELWENGDDIETEYDSAERDDPKSRDATALISVTDPMSEPRIHRAMPGGIGDLEVYRLEVLNGIHDDWINEAAGKWQYTYHERMTSYSVPGVKSSINQIDRVIDILAKTPYTRRANIVLWKPWKDIGYEHPCCLISLWFRVFGDRLTMNASMRSNDAYKAAFMNMYAFTELQAMVADKLSERVGHEIKVGTYNHIVNSYHIYGSYFEDFKKFLEIQGNRTFEERTFRTEDVSFYIEEVRNKYV